MLVPLYIYLYEFNIIFNKLIYYINLILLSIFSISLGFIFIYFTLTINYLFFLFSLLLYISLTIFCIDPKKFIFYAKIEIQRKKDIIYYIINNKLIVYTYINLIFIFCMNFFIYMLITINILNNILNIDISIDINIFYIIFKSIVLAIFIFVFYTKFIKTYKHEDKYSSLFEFNLWLIIVLLPIFIIKFVFLFICLEELLGLVLKMFSGSGGSSQGPSGHSGSSGGPSKPGPGGKRGFIDPNRPKSHHNKGYFSKIMNRDTDNLAWYIRERFSTEIDKLPANEKRLHQTDSEVRERNIRKFQNMIHTELYDPVFSGRRNNYYYSSVYEFVRLDHGIDLRSDQGTRHFWDKLDSIRRLHKDTPTKYVRQWSNRY